MWAVFVLFAEAPKYREGQTTESLAKTWDVLSHSVLIHDHEAHALPEQINKSWRHSSHVILFKDGGYTRTCSGISRAATIMAWSSLVFWRTIGGMGLQQAKIPCWSRGNASAIWSNMWFGRTYLKIEHGVVQSEHNMIQYCNCAYPGFTLCFRRQLERCGRATRKVFWVRGAAVN